MTVRPSPPTHRTPNAGATPADLPLEWPHRRTLVRYPWMRAVRPPSQPRADAIASAGPASDVDSRRAA